jgi:2-dehydro-3-deoxy-D-arabinonate dehydratase
MRLCRYWNPDSGATLGLVRDDKVYDLSSADPQHFGSFSGLFSIDGLARLLEAAETSAATNRGIAFSELDTWPDRARPHLLAPVTEQEVWAAGVTYLRSRDARMDESEAGGSFYDKVYYASRPELFFKATPNRVAGQNGEIRIRADSKWNVPEPEIALLVSVTGKVLGYTIGNDVSSRDIEGANPLYLPQAKVYLGSCALGPTILLAQSFPDVRQLGIHLVIRRNGRIGVRRQHERGPDEAHLRRPGHIPLPGTGIPHGVILLTGTGVVPPDEFTLQSGDLVEITVPEIGTLRNRGRLTAPVAQASRAVNEVRKSSVRNPKSAIRAEEKTMATVRDLLGNRTAVYSLPWMTRSIGRRSISAIGRCEPP